MSAGGAIPRLWKSVLRDHAIETISTRGSDLIALYTDYESDRSGAYTFILGLPVSTVGDIPGGMIARQVPSGLFAEFTASNPTPQTIVPLWQQIWQLEDDHRLTRAYRTDFEVHRFNKAAETQVAIYVGVRK